MVVEVSAAVAIAATVAVERVAEAMVGKEREVAMVLVAAAAAAAAVAALETVEALETGEAAKATEAMATALVVAAIAAEKTMVEVAAEMGTAAAPGTSRVYPPSTTPPFSFWRECKGRAGPRCGRRGSGSAARAPPLWWAATEGSPRASAGTTGNRGSSDRRGCPCSRLRGSTTVAVARVAATAGPEAPAARRPAAAEQWAKDAGSADRQIVDPSASRRLARHRALPGRRRPHGCIARRGLSEATSRPAPTPAPGRRAGQAGRGRRPHSKCTRRRASASCVWSHWPQSAAAAAATA